MFKILETFDTKFSADSVEWCPIEGFRDYFVCGTYELLKPAEHDCESSLNHPQKRQGSIYLFRVISPGKLDLQHRVDVPGVLDMKWAHIVYQGHILLGVVNSAGYLQIWKLEKEGKISLLLETRIRHVDDEYLALSLDWNTGRSSCAQSTDTKIIISDSKGFLTIYSISQGNLNLIASQKAHDFEVWITAFNYWDTNVVYSGGDDCMFKWFDIRCGLQSMGCNKIHTAGVTSLHSNAGRECILASGSYDEILRLWDTRNLRRPISETNLAGGIWRLKWDPFDQKYLFAACMYSNFKIIDCRNNESPKIIGELSDHESIAYGCDWSSLSEGDIINELIAEESKSKIVLAATCSFYDHTLKLSAVNLDIDL